MHRMWTMLTVVLGGFLLFHVGSCTSSNCSAEIEVGKVWTIGNESINWFQANVSTDREPLIPWSLAVETEGEVRMWIGIDPVKEVVSDYWNALGQGLKSVTGFIIGTSETGVLIGI
jgi:hypothetical protein